MNTLQSKAVECALVRIASNVAKHIVGRSGWTEDDACFQVDLRESVGEIMAMIEMAGREQAAEIERLKALNASLARLAAGQSELFNKQQTEIERLQQAYSMGAGKQ